MKFGKKYSYECKGHGWKALISVISPSSAYEF